MFEDFKFSERQIKNYYESAIKDFNIAQKYKNSDVAFVFSYNSLIKLAITVCAKNNLRIKSRQGHHIELIGKMAELLKDKEIEIIANEMRSKRNKSLYGGAVIITEKEARTYVDFLKQVIKKTDKYLGKLI
ncbi:MAG: hypothetical protein PHO90_01010 [Candidatus Pacebacteria bacterium]|nr:hypothetical protein [Candidatus Paceibacterota bacterium]